MYPQCSNQIGQYLINPLYLKIMNVPFLSIKKTMSKFAGICYMILYFCGFSIGSNHFLAKRVYCLCVYFMIGATVGTTVCGSGEAGALTSDSWFIRHGTYLLHHGSLKTFYGFSTGSNQFWAGGITVCVCIL